MKITFGTNIHKAQLVMELDISQPDEKRLSNKILRHKPVISIQHFLAGGANENAAVIIWDGNTPVKKIIGKWKFGHTVNKKNTYTNYFRFTPFCDVESFALETVDEDTDEHYLYYTFNDYKKLQTKEQQALQFQYGLDPFEFKEVMKMNSLLIPLIYTLQPGYHDADKWINQLLNKPDTINWQAAFTYSFDTEMVGACIFDVDQKTGLMVYEKFFTLKMDRMKKVVPGKPYVYEFEYDATYEPEDVMVMDVINSDGSRPFDPQMVILK